MQEQPEGKRPSKWVVMVLAATFVAAVAGLLWSYSLAGRLTHAEAQLAATQKQNEQLATALDETNAKLRVTRQTLGHRLGATQRELRRRANDLLHRQRATAKKLAQEEAEESAEAQAGTQEQASPQLQGGTQAQGGTATQVGVASRQSTGAVAGNAAEAKSSVGGKTGLPQTQGQPAGAVTQMRKAQGDLGIESGLIATNERELKVLEQLGTRDYYPFTLRKGKKQAVSTVELELRRVNVKHKRYTMTVFVGRKKIEKKNRTLDEPVQFYVGQQHVLYELVVNQIGRGEVQGYLATPKGVAGKE